MSVADNLAHIKETIGNKPIKLIAVTKSVGPEGIQEAFNCGISEFAENRVQDALVKRRELMPSLACQLNWHFIGHLQSNKVRQVVGQFDLIHSIDSLHIAREVSKEAKRNNLLQRVLLQVKVLPDPNKYGFTPEDLRHDFSTIVQLPNIHIEGLMTICPLTSTSAIWRDCFSGLRLLRDELEASYQVKLKELSMGMTQDWQEAINCGATMLRLGRAIFGS